MGRKTIKLLFLFTFILVLVFSICKTTFSLETMENTYDIEEYLHDEKVCTKKNLIDDGYDKVIETNNPVQLATLKAVSLESKFSLEDIIPENIVYRNQGNTYSCYAFTTMWCLETSLALDDYYAGKTPVKYDFSERHLQYTLSKSCCKDGTNTWGYNKTITAGVYDEEVYAYLTNGSGAILEKDLPFQNNTNKIYLSDIQNQNTATRVYDMNIFKRTSLKKNDEKMLAIKNHIKYEGALGASMYYDSNYINYSTGAYYSGGSSINHAVAIIGWDDNYSRTNFKSGNRPSGDGAWIVLNSYGSYFDKMYISYYDYGATKSLYGFSNVSTDVNYDYIYQYDWYGPSGTKTYDSQTLYLANQYTKKTNNVEYLTDVAIHAAETYQVKVYVNPNGTSMEKANLQQVKLKAGNYETIGHGYHTLEFAEPIKLTGSSFAVVLEIKTNDNSSTSYYVEQRDSGDYNDVTYTGKSYYGGESAFNGISSWTMLTKDNTIKAFTVAGVSNLIIKSKPNKTTYIEGENFNKTGMIVLANYNNGKQETITDYTVTGGTNLKKGQTYVTITYRNGSVKLPITVESNSVTSLKIKNSPTKTTYIEGENFNKTGLVIEATYKDGTKKEVTNYQITDGTNLKENQSYVTISYEGKTVKQIISVTKVNLTNLEITKNPTKTTYLVGENFDKTGMLVRATYGNGKNVLITSYKVLNGTNLKKGQTEVEISFGGKTVSQKINVIDKEVLNIKVKQEPTKTKYIKDLENIDLTGGILEVTYTDGTTFELLMNSNSVTVTGFSNKKEGPITVTISYQGKKAEIIIQIITAEGPKSSNFKNSKGIVNNIKSYSYTDKTKESYMLIEVEINNIERFQSNEEFKYLYYLSPNETEINIKDWVEIKEEQMSNSTLNFVINTKDIKNYNEITNSNNLYLYITEIVTKNGENRMSISKTMLEKSEIEIETYIDDVLKENKKDDQKQNKLWIYIVIIIALALTGTGIFLFLYKKTKQ